MDIKINISRIKKLLKEIPEEILSRVLLILIFIVLVEVLAGAIIYYKYSYLPQKEEIKLTEKPVVLKEGLLSRILEKSAEKEIKFKEESSKTYFNPFKAQEAIPIEQQGNPAQ